MNIKELAQKHEEYIIERRRYYHSCPELSREEFETTRQLQEDVKAMGLTPVTVEGTCGFWADIVGGKPGKMVALRADMDGLPVKEKTGLPFASTNGNMHACGHDAHVSMLLGAAKILVDCKEELSGSVRLIFQAAEEVVEGAELLINAGVLKGVDMVYGAHIWADLDYPYIDVTAGNRMAAADLFEVTVKGMAAHGSSPHQGIDALVCASAMVMNLQTYVSRNSSPIDPIVINVGELHAGTRFNIIANEAKLIGMNRRYSPINKLEEGFRRICENTAATYGATVEIDYKELVGMVVNKDEEAIEIARDAVTKLYGKETLGKMDTLMGSEDFSRYMNEVPGVFAFIGSNNVKSGKTYKNHHEQYDVDEDSLARGSAVMAQFSVDFLSK